MTTIDMTEKPVCFVIAPIGDEGSDIRDRSDKVLKHIIAPAAEQCGYQTVRADQISEPGIITSQVIQRLVDEPLVIADLTGQNANVFYELAIRHAVKKPVVQLIQLGERVPFDVAATRIIHVDHRDLDSVARCKEEIVRQIRAVERDPAQVDTPISLALDLQFLRQSGDPIAKSMAEAVSLLQEIKQAVVAQAESRSLDTFSEWIARRRGRSAADRWSIDRREGPQGPQGPQGWAEPHDTARIDRLNEPGHGPEAGSSDGGTLDRPGNSR